MLIISLLSLLKLASTLMMGQQYREHFLTDGEWIMRHVDPKFNAGGLLIPVLKKNEVRNETGDTENLVKSPDTFLNQRSQDGNTSRNHVQFSNAGENGAGTLNPSTRGSAEKLNEGSGYAGENNAEILNPSTGGSAEKSNEGSGYAGKNNAGGFAGKPYCAEYTPKKPLPFFYNELPMDGTTGGIAKRGPALTANKLKLNNEMKTQDVPDELRPLIMAFAMIETDDLTLDQITEYMRSKTMETGRCFGIMNVNFGHRSHLKLDGEMSNQELDGLTDKYYAGTDKANAEKVIMREAVKVFNSSFTKIGIYCTILFHRGGSTLFNDNALGVHKDWHPQIFFDSAANTYNAIVKDMTLMTDDRRVWFNVKEV